MSRDFSRFPLPALEAVAKAAKDEPLATVYVPSAPKEIIVCAHNTIEKGFQYEQDDPVSMPWDVPNERLGQSVWEALLLLRHTPGVNLRSQKKADWPAYRASGCKSVRAFEEEFVRVSVRGLSTILRVEGSVPAPAAKGLFVGRDITSACDFESLGELVRLVHRCSLQLATHEFE